MQDAQRYLFIFTIILWKILDSLLHYMKQECSYVGHVSDTPLAHVYVYLVWDLIFFVFISSDTVGLYTI